MLIGIGFLGILLLSIGIFIAKKALKMKARGKEDFKLYAIGCTVMMSGMILLIYCGLALLFSIVLFN